MDKKSIKYWAIDDRPREKLLTIGAEKLSNSELLAILINNGTKNVSAIELAKNLLNKADNNINELCKLSIKEILNFKIKGLGPAKAVTIKAALELGLRRETVLNKKEKVTTSYNIAQFLKSKLQYKKHEVFAVVFLNRANKINHFEIISEGGITGTVADPRIILKKALEHDAVSIILSHNHPSGNLSPSLADEQLTAKIKQAAMLLDIIVLDHIIVSEEGYYSFADDGKL